jgi:hypothetical protein
MKPKLTKIFLFLLLGTGFTFYLSFGQPKIKLPKNVETIIRHNCSVSGCHQGKYPVMNLNYEPDKFLTAVLNVPSQEIPSLKLIDTNSPEKSYLLMKTRGDKDIAGKRMPLNYPPLKDEDIQIIQAWILSLKESGTDTSRSMPQGEKISASAVIQQSKKNRFTKPSFWGTRLINLPTTQTTEKGHFLFRISHRYLPAVRSGYDSFYGVDGPSFILLSIGYGINDNLSITLGRSNLYQEAELSLHWLIFEQGKKTSMPFTAALHWGGSWVTQSQPGKEIFQSKNFKFNLQLSLSHQISNKLSLLLVPAYSSNTNHWEPSSEGTLALGVGGRFILVKDIALIGEWIPVLSGYKANSNGWGWGIEKKIGGHVFQIFILNSFGLTSDQFIPGGDLRLSNNDFRIGFNIFRSF